THRLRGRRIGAESSGLMQDERLLVGWFMQCLACRATFIWTTPANMRVERSGRILTRNSTAGKPKLVGVVTCPTCLSGNVRLLEIGDGK
ncbi:MAG: hypothetical protein ACYS21_12100, partial [Planctomycetota bacterium]